MAHEVNAREARRTLWRLRRKVEEEAEEINFLNIMPMMDMMTILLVFLIKQFSVQQLAMNTQAGLQLPASTAQKVPQPAVNITITQTAVVVEGDAVVQVKGGAIDPAWKQGGATGYAINPARDFGPRVVYALLPIKGKQKIDWAYAWVPIVGPLIGALLAAGLYSANF